MASIVAPSRRLAGAGAGKKKSTGGGAAAGKSPHEDQFMAAAIGDAEWLRQSLKESGAPGAFDRNGLAAVHLAAIHGRLECLRLLIEHYKCDVNSRSGTGWRPVHLCISAQTGGRSLQCLLYLLDKGADHSCANDDLVTPVHQAASEGHLQALQLLIKLGAKLDQADARGFRPIDMAKIWGHQKCARLLATETWHREKDQVARKLHMDKRVAMRDLLRQFEQEERVSADMRYQGKEPFGEWVQQIEESKTAAATATATGGRRPRRHRPSSQEVEAAVQPPASQAAKVAAAVMVSPAERHRQPMDTADGGLQRDHLRARVREVIEEANEILRESSVAPTDGWASATPRQLASQTKPALKLADHSQDWNFSAKVPDCFHPYQRALEDVYPRDTFTKMPHPTNSYPLRLNVRSAHPEATLAGEADRRAMRSLGRERGGGVGEVDAGGPDGDHDDETSSAAGSSRRDHPDLQHQQLRLPSCRENQLFATQSVLDIQRRKRFEEAVRRNRGEAAAHLTSDPTSFLFRDALGLAPIPPPQQPAAASSTSSAAASPPATASRRSGSRKSSRKLASPRLSSAKLKVQ